MDWSFIFEHVSFEICSQIDLFSPNWWGNAGRFILQKKKRNPPRKWACLWQGTVWWKRRERSCYSAGRLLVTRGKSLIWPPAALISPSQLSFSSPSLHIGPFLVLIVTPLKFSLSQIMEWHSLFVFWLKPAKIKLQTHRKHFRDIYQKIKNRFICCDTLC